jgi:hypothetical protein
MQTSGYIDANQAYRSERMSCIQSTWLNQSIPFQFFITFNPVQATLSYNISVVTDLIHATRIRYGSLISAAVAYETFPHSRDVHTHLCIASPAILDPVWIESCLRFKPVRYKVLPYSDPAILSYVLKTTNTELINCELYLKAPATSRERRRLRRMQERSPVLAQIRN